MGKHSGESRRVADEPGRLSNGLGRAADEPGRLSNGLGRVTKELRRLLNGLGRLSDDSELEFSSFFACFGHLIRWSMAVKKKGI